MSKEKIVKFLRKNLEKLLMSQHKELEWAHIYHDSIRGKECINELPLNIGRWAGGYSFFYVLNRILSDYKPKKILELGLGESSKVISTYLDNYLLESEHTIIEESHVWKENFEERFTLSSRSYIRVHLLLEKDIKGNKVNCYGQIEELSKNKYDLYLVDGPLGSAKYSRYDIIEILKFMNKEDDFIIIFDDLERNGEKQTFDEMIKLFKKKEIEIYLGYYEGKKKVATIGTKKYRFVNSL